MALFTSDIADETFQSIFDRVATTKDFEVVKGIVLFFLNKHFTGAPKGLGEEETSKIKKRRKKAVKIMESMEVLTYVGNTDSMGGRD
jgi:hypothetical protein